LKITNPSCADDATLKRKQLLHIQQLPCNSAAFTTSFATSFLLVDKGNTAYLVRNFYGN
jgi:hypothetical protein